MKKLFYLLVVLTMFGMIACSEDDKTELRWENQSGDLTASDIRWVPASGGNDVEYSKTLTADGEQTEWKEISDRYGSGYCALGGAEGEIIIDDNNTRAISLSEGSSETYRIRSNTAKK